MAKFEFPQQITYDSQVWHLVYAPSVESTILPNLEGFTIVNTDFQPVKMPGRSNPVFIRIIDLISPAHTNQAGEVVSEKRMKGFRLYFEPPLNTNVSPNSCVFYLTVPSPSDGVSSSQKFFDAIIGQSQKALQQQAKADIEWCDELANLKESSNEQQASQQDGEKRAISD